MSEHPLGWLSLLPPVVAIVLAIATRRVLLSLLLGIFSGALLTTGFDLPRAVGETLEVHLWKTLVDESKCRVFAFTLLMGAMVGVINRSGGMLGLVNLVTRWARGRRAGQVTAWLLGLMIFFDDYANTVLLGNTLRPLCDRLRISREKLAYLVDSTAAPVAAVALVSTWIAVEMAYIQDGIDSFRRMAVAMDGKDPQPADDGAGEPKKTAGRADVSGADRLRALDLFVATIPYRFYVLGALLLVLLIALADRDFGPMLEAERQFAGRIEPSSRSEQPGLHDPTQPHPDTPPRWYNAAVPVGVTVAAIVWLLYASGTWALENRALGTASVERALDGGVGEQGAMDVAHWRDVLGAADSGLALLWGSLAGLSSAAFLAWLQRLLSARQIYEAAGAGARLMLPALAILWFASALSRMTGSDSLGTGTYLGELLGSRISPSLMPTAVFLLASAVSFATGTSFGTMGLLVPIVIPLTGVVLASSGKPIDPNDPLLLATVGSVLAGAIFGDHCSPISDTTILSSQASGCDHTAHVWTQLPYALLAAAVAMIGGTLPVGFGVPVGWCLLGSAVLLAAAVWFLGKPVTRRPPCPVREDRSSR